MHLRPKLHRRGEPVAPLIAELLLAAALAFTFGCAKTDWIDRTLVTVDVTGTWEGTLPTGIGLLFELEQQGSTVKGFMRTTMGASQPFGLRPGAIEGTVAGDVFRFRQSDGTAEGELTVSGDEMTGRASLGRSDRLSLRRVDPSPRPASPPR
jgi:hypothetical protein